MNKPGREPTRLVPVPSPNIIPERDVDKTPILEAQHLGIDFGGLTAVDEFNMAIGRTEIAGLIGPNGAGKTTVFNLLTKVYQPTRGTILLDGIDTAGKSTVQVNRMGIARTFQNIRLFSNLSVEDNVKIGLHNHIKYGTLQGCSVCPGTGRRSGLPTSVHWNCCPFSTCRIWPAPRRAVSPTAPSAAWRSSAPWPPIPPCCSWMSPRPA